MLTKDVIDHSTIWSVFLKHFRVSQASYMATRRAATYLGPNTFSKYFACLLRLEGRLMPWAVIRRLSKAD